MLRKVIDRLRDVPRQRAELDELRRSVDEFRRAVEELHRSVAAQGDAVGATNESLLKLGTLVYERLSSPEAVEELTKAGWRRARPTVELTWNTAMTGDEFLGHLVEHCGASFGRVVEIGPGYGRVLRSLLASDVRFEAYDGLDISPENVKHLATTFAEPRLRFTNTDFRTHRLEAPADLVYSSAVFLHVYPSVAPALAWCRDVLGAGGHLCFDVPHGQRRYVHGEWGLYVREYEEPELRDLVASAGFARCTVVPEREFAPGAPGWFVAAQKA